jgi:membrane protein DedA with SNARE-associated domain
VDPIQALIQFLEGLSNDPVAYSVVFFIYSVAATVFLPIPVEIGLFFSPETSIVVKALVLGAGKAVGSIIVFMLGDRLGNGLNGWAMKYRFFRGFLDLMRRFVARTRYIGLYIILSIPLMVDTVPIYLFALFNQKGVMKLRYFAATNFFAGITRAALVFGIATAFNIRLV